MWPQKPPVDDPDFAAPQTPIVSDRAVRDVCKAVVACSAIVAGTFLLYHHPVPYQAVKEVGITIGLLILFVFLLVAA